MSNEQKLQQIEQQMREHAMAIITLHERAGELFNTGGYATAKEKHEAMLTGIIDYLQEQLPPSDLLKQRDELLEALKEINGLCADAGNTESGKLNVGQVAKISITAIKNAEK